MGDGAAAATTEGASGGGAQEPVQAQAPASQESRKERAAKARADAAAKHKPTPTREAFDPRREAKRAMAERKKLRLAAEDGERVEEFDPGEGDDQAISPRQRGQEHSPGSEFDEDPAHDDDDGAADQRADEKEPEKPPTWAKKLKEQVESHKQREAKWNEAIAKIEHDGAAKDRKLQESTWTIEDMKDEATLHKNLISQLMGMLEKVAPGKFVRESLDLVLARAENKRLAKAAQRGQQTLQQHQQGLMRADVTGKVRAHMNGLRTQHPELDWEKSQAAKAFFTRYAQRGIPVDEITTDEIRDFIAAQRFAASNARRGNQQGQGADGKRPTDVPERPEQSVARGGVGARQRAQRNPGINTPITNSVARKLVRDFRAAKSARQ